MSNDIKRCPCCGQVVLPPPARLHLTPQQQRIWDAVKLRPRTTEELRAVLYGGYARAPVEKAVHVVVYQLNRRLQPFGIKLRNPGRRDSAMWTRYQIEELSGMERSPDQKRVSDACAVDQSSRNIDA